MIRRLQYLAPQTLDEAVRALASYGEDAKILAAGRAIACSS